MKGRVGRYLAACAIGAFVGLPTTLSHAQTADVDTLIFTSVANVASDGSSEGCGDPADVGWESHPSLDEIGGCADVPSGASICEATSTDDILPADACVADSIMFINNIVCGTGAAIATVNIDNGPDLGQVLGLTIVFIANQGVITGSSTDGGSVVGTMQVFLNGVPADGPLDCADGLQFTVELSAT